MKFIRKFFSKLGAGENFLTPGPGPGFKTRKNRDFGRLASPKTGGPKRELNGVQNGPKSVPKMEPFFVSPKVQKLL